MNLRTVHQILIVAAVALAALVAVRSAVLFARGGGVAQLGLCVAAAAAAVAAFVYLRQFRTKLRG